MSLLTRIKVPRIAFMGGQLRSWSISPTCASAIQYFLRLHPYLRSNLEGRYRQDIYDFFIYMEK